MVQNPKFLLFARSTVEMAAIGRALRDVGHVVVPARSHELGIDALVRVGPTIALIPEGHEAATSPEFRARAHLQGTRIYLFAQRDGDGNGAAVSRLHGDPHPRFEFTGSPAVLATLIDEVARSDDSLLWERP